MRRLINRRRISGRRRAARSSSSIGAIPQCNNKLLIDSAMDVRSDRRTSFMASALAGIPAHSSLTHSVAHWELGSLVMNHIRFMPPRWPELNPVHNLLLHSIMQRRCKFVTLLERVTKKKKRRKGRMGWKSKIRSSTLDKILRNLCPQNPD